MFDTETSRDLVVGVGMDVGHGGRSVPLRCYTGKRFARVRFNHGQQSPDPPEAEEPLHEVRIIDNDHNTYQEVMEITMMALGIDEEQAFAIAWEVDHYGSCVVALACRDEAQALANVIRVIGIEVRVSPVIMGRSQ